jgi:hypothetical protein
VFFIDKEIIATPSNGVRGIYSSSATGFSQTAEFAQPAPGGGVFSTIKFVNRQEDNLAFQAVSPDQRRGDLPYHTGFWESRNHRHL